MRPAVRHGAGRAPRILNSDEYVYDLQHADGEPCPVVDLLCEVFGEHDGMILLWEATCFPCSDVEAWEQAKEIVRRNCTP